MYVLGMKLRVVETRGKYFKQIKVGSVHVKFLVCWYFVGLCTESKRTVHGLRGE